MRKKLFTFLLALAASVGLMNAAADDSGSCGANVTYSFNGATGAMTITGTGPMTDYASMSDVPWNSYRDDITSVTITDGVTSVGSYSFGYHENLVTVTIGNDVETIGDYAFGDCYKFTTLNLGNSVRHIGNRAFMWAKVLTGFTLPSTLETIGDYAFCQNKVITTLTIPSNVTSIGQYAFYNCIALTSITTEATTPPTLGEKALSNVPTSIPLYVPNGSVGAYTAADQWNAFNITGYDPAPAGFETVEIDFRTNPLTMNSGAATLVSGTWNDAQHGYYNPVVSTALEAGNYKITVGNCQFGNGTGSVKNEDGSATLDLIDENGQTITSFTTPKNCYADDDKVTSVWFVANADQTIRIVCPQYTPYLKVEQVESVPEAVTVYTVTFANADDATGIVPAAQANLAPNTIITLPKNSAMYKPGATMTAWTDGSNYFAPNTSYTVTGNVTLTAVYSDNTVTLNDRTAEVTIKWLFSQSDGVPAIFAQGSTTFVLAQAEVGGKTIDVQLPIDATEGKFANSSNSWTQVNPGVIFSIPSAKDAVITYKQYDAGAVTTPEIKVTASETTYLLTAEGTSGQLYYEYIQVVLPKNTATAIDNVNANANAAKRIENGMLLIEHNGKTYTVTGQQVK